MSSPQRTILVTGATGKQGRAVIDALLQLPSNLFHILAMARDPSSKGAQRLASLSPSVELIQGDLRDMPAVFARASRPIWGVYSVQINSDDEVAQGTGVIDAAVGAGSVRHIVYASGDRGGPARSDADATAVKNFAAKFAIERHLQAAVEAQNSNKKQQQQGESSGGDDRADTTGLTYTILRPVTFMENMSTDRHGKGFGRMWMQMGAGAAVGEGNRSLQLISVRDIGWFAAQAFSDPMAPTYRDRAVSIAGDELTARQAQAVFKEVTGKDMPMAPCLVGKALKTFLRDTVGDMFEWFDTQGYGADVQACRAANPGMLDYRTWLKNYSGFV